jgi:hypothetical protein
VSSGLTIQEVQAIGDVDLASEAVATLQSMDLVQRLEVDKKLAPICYVVSNRSTLCA